MKKLKILIVFIFVVILTGCSGTYNLKINKDFSVEEDLILKINKKDEETYNKTIKLFKSNKIKKDKYKVTSSNDEVKIKYSEKYKSLEDYLANDKVYRQMFDNLDYSFSDGILSIQASSNMFLKKNDSNYIYNDFDISSLKINLDSQFNVKNSNADINNNSLSWIIDDNTRNKEISVELDVTDKKNKITDILVISLISIVVVGFIAFVIIKIINKRKI